MRNAFPPRPLDAHKYSVGTVAVVGGSRRFPHAPAICGLGARAAGAGLIHLTVPEESRIAAALLVPEATIADLSTRHETPKADVTAVGMGLGTGKASDNVILRTFSSGCERFVIDADALTVISTWSHARLRRFASGGRSAILTPHAGEAARLLGCKPDEIQSGRAKAAMEIACRYDAVCVLKGRGTIVCAPDGRVYTCKAGNPFMAMGGMGDLLSGVIAARWARTKCDAYSAACAAVWLHAAASDALTMAATPTDPSISNTVAQIGSIRVKLERRGGKKGTWNHDA